MEVHLHKSVLFNEIPGLQLNISTRYHDGGRQWQEMRLFATKLLLLGGHYAVDPPGMSFLFH